MRWLTVAFVYWPLLLALAVGLSFSFYPRSVLAQEQTPIPTILEGPVGPYHLTVQAIPYPPTQGLLNLHATVQNPDTGAKVDDTRVLVFAQRHESAERGRALLLNSPATPTSYSAQLNILEEGGWTFTFEVSGPLGEGSAEVDLEVAKQPRTLSGWLAWAGMAVALLVVLGLAWRNSNRVRRPSTG